MTLPETILPVVGIAALLLPNWLLLVSVVPMLMVLGNTLLIPPLFSIGDADIQIYDLIIFIVALKVLCSTLVYKRQIYMYSPVIVFLALLVITTLLNWYRLEGEVFTEEMTALLRFIVQVSCFFLFVHSARASRQLEFSHKLLHLGGYIAASSIYLNMVLFTSGIQIGEVYAGDDFARFFGPLGDSVKLLLLPFIYKELLANKFLRASFLAGALLATGGRIGIIALGVGVVLIVFYIGNTRAEYMYVRKSFIVFASFLGVLGLGLWLNLGGMMTRFTNDEIFGSDLTQRMVRIDLAAHVFWDNIITGVGYTGYRFAALDYGSKYGAGIGPYHNSTFLATTSNQYLQTTTDAGVFGVVVFLWMMAGFLQLMRRAIMCVNGELRNFLEAGYIWILSLLIVSPVVTWLLPGSIIGYTLWMILGIAAVTVDMAQRAASTREASYGPGYQDV